MFLFKLTLPLLGTATLGAVGTGIYYGVDFLWKNGGKKTKPVEAKSGSDSDSSLEKGQKQTEVLPRTESPSEEETVSSPSLDQSGESQVTLVVETHPKE